KTGRFAPWWRTAAIAAVAAALATAVPVAVVRPSVEQGVERAFSSGHRRGMVSGRLTDVASSDRHAVKPWLSSRLGFSPQVPDLAGRGFELVGGRVDVIDGEPAAVLVYRRRQHVIDVFVRPAGRESDAFHSTRNGLNVLHLRHADTSLWLVSDLNANELKDLARLLAVA